MDASDICRREIVFLGADASPQSAAQAMWRERGRRTFYLRSEP